MGQIFGPIGYLFNIIFTYPIFNGLILLYQLFGDFGLSIIVLTLVIKLLLFPLTLQQLKSMKATQALQPQMAEISKKYAKDQQGKAVAMQALYKEYGVNPVAGCLPLLIQLPVLYGLFYALNNNVLKASNVGDLNSHLYPFVPRLLNFPNVDLNWFTFIDPRWHFSLAHPDPTHILPILAGIATFVQLRMSQPKTASTAANDPSTQSMKTMQYVMPFITVFFGWTFAAGMALYWTISSIFQAVQQYFITGWGSLLIVPNLGGGSNTPVSSKGNGTVKAKAYAGDQRRERELVQQDEELEAGVVESNGNGPVGSRLRTVPRSSNASSRRRQRGSSASARRRGSTQRSR